MDIFDNSTWFSILTVVGILLLVGAVFMAIRDARRKTPEHFDRVLEETTKLVDAGRRERALERLAHETQRLVDMHDRSDALNVRLARLRLAHGRLLDAAGKHSDAVRPLRDAIATLGAERAVLDDATVLLLRTRSLAPQDVQLFLDYLSRAPNRLEPNDPFVLALDEAHYRRLFEDGAIRNKVMALADRLRAKGVTLAWMLRVQAEELTRSGARAQAITVLNILVAEEQATPDDRRALAQLYVEQGDLQAAHHIYQALTEEDEAPVTDLRAAGLIALQYFESTTHSSTTVLAAASDRLARAAESEKNHAPTWAALGRACRLLKQPGKARTAYERALQCGGDDAPNHIALADILLEQSFPAQALPHLRRAAEITTVSGDLWTRCGKLALELGDEEAALHAFESAVACRPVLAEAALTLAQIRHRRGDHARVVELLDARNDLPAEFLPVFGRSLAHVGKHEQAIRQLKAYAKSHRSDQRIRLELAMLHGRLGQWANAAEIFASITDASLQATALPYHAYVCLRNGDAADAAKLAAQARAANAANALVHHVFAALALTDKNAARAREEWDAALQLDPKFAPALHGLAKLCEQEKNYSAAARLYAMLREAAPDQRHAAVRIGVCLTRAGRYSEALAAFASLGADVDANVEAMECAVYCHAKLQQWKDAAAALEKLPKTGRRAAAKQRNVFVIRYEFARGLYRDKDYEQARRQLELLPANQLGQAAVTRAIFAAQTAVVGRLLPPKDHKALHGELQHLRRIAPASFAARVVPALVDLARSGRAPQWASIADVRPSTPAQQTALAILAAAAGETTAAQSLLTDSSDTIGRLLHGVAAANSQQWDDAFVALRDALSSTDPTSRSLDELIRLTAACGIAAGKVADVRTLLETFAANRQAMRILGVVAAAEGRTDEADRLLSKSNIDGVGAAETRQLLIWRRFVATVQSGDHAAAAAALESAPPEIRSHPALARAQLDLRIRGIETSVGDSARHAKARQGLRGIAPELLTPPRALRRAAIAATRLAAQNVGVRADVIADHRLAAALWATALEGPYLWDSLNHDRTRQKRSPLSTETREKLKAAAREKLLTSLRSNTGHGWTKDEVDLGCAWIEYEFTCAALFEKCGVGYGLSGWPKGLAVAPMLLMEDTLDAEQREERAALRAARTTITATLAQQVREGRTADKSTDARRLAAYLPKKVGFADYLIDADRPGLALQQLADAPHNSATVRELRGRALVAQALKLSASPTGVTDALQMFEQAAALKTNLVPHRSDIIDAAVAASRNALNTHGADPATALQPLEVATRLAGKATPLDQGRAAVFVQQALKLKESKDMDGAVRKLREALALHDAEPTRILLAGVLRDKSIAALMKRKHQEALDTMRECVRLEKEGAEQEIDYQARCDLQMEMINLGTSIATKTNASIRDLRTAVAAGEDAMWFLKDSDSDNFLGAALSELGRMLALDENWTEAISSLEKSLRYRNHDGTKTLLGIALYVRGARAYDSGNRSSGSADIKRAYQLHPGDDDIRRAYLHVIAQGW